MKTCSLRRLFLVAICLLLGRSRLPAQASSGPEPWWKHAVLYEIYPRSFQDSNGDGIGDINGITSRLPYLERLGVDAIWISPFYPSPQVDFGYDIANYQDIDPQYGTLADFDRLVAEGKKHHIRILLDMVLNHTSDKHPWFAESRSSLSNPKRDWYVWRDGRAGGTPPGNPPNNWTSLFGHSAWQYDEVTGQYYYHRFYRQQPDLNWRNPAVEKAMFDAMRFWLDRGVAGFRLDAITTLFEDPTLQDAAVYSGFDKFGERKQDRRHYDDLPEEHDVVRRMRVMADGYSGNRVLIGETYLHDAAALNSWYGAARHDELHLPMDMQVGFPKGPLNAVVLRRALDDAENHIDGNQPLFVFDNHDNTRSWDRLGDGAHNDRIARAVATLLLTTHATALLYYGQEIGMTTSTPTRKEDVKDPIGITGWPEEKGRDGERTPMQWSSGPAAGFSASRATWLPVPANHATVNVGTEDKDPQSLLNWYRRLIAERRKNAALRDGSQRLIDTTNANVLAYVRHAPGTPDVLVAVNLSAGQQTLSLSDLNARPGSMLHTILTDMDMPNPAAAAGTLMLPAFASVIASVQ